MSVLQPKDKGQVIPLEIAARPRISPAPEVTQAPRPDVGRHFVDIGQISARALLNAQASATQLQARVEDILIARGDVTSKEVTEAHADLTGARCVTLEDEPGDPRLLDVLGAERAIQMGVLPWKRLGRTVVVAVSAPHEFDRHYDALSQTFGPLAMVLAPKEDIATATVRLRPHTLAQAAETRLPAEDSARHLAPKPLVFGAVVGALGLAAMLAPLTSLAVVTGLALVMLALWTGLKITAGYFALRDKLDHTEPKTPPAAAPTFARKPVVSLLVPLFRETKIASHLLQRLQALDYPPELLDVLLIVEADDFTTRACLEETRLPGWMRVVTVPKGEVRTKPRALNFALNFCRGSVVGIYDAEDAPAPDQLTRVVSRFAEAPPEIGCLQGRLDYYHSRKNWLSRCFTLEYATWFDVILPGLARLGFPIPLGGTTLFFRRQVLEGLGAWDAHNVTEDADLGIRLARRGYRTELINTVTEEEPNCQPWPWVKQRSRWLKGYAITYLVHMRNPRALWRDLGPRGFFGFQMLFAGTLIGFLAAPALWSFWLVPFGGAHPLMAAWGSQVVLAMGIFFFASELISIAVTALAAWRTGNLRMAPWALTMMAYFPLGTLAMYKGAFEVLCRPFYWDKTDHGRLGPTDGLTRLRPTSGG